MTQPVLHPALEAFTPLVGTFRGEGRGSYPTISPFRYVEEVRFESLGGPSLAYSQRTWDPDSGRPMHAESGFLRPGGAGRAELLLAHSFGLTELQEGTLEVAQVPPGALTLQVASQQIGVARTAKPVRAIRRTYTVSGSLLRTMVWMSYGEVEDAEHLSSELRRIA